MLQCFKVGTGVLRAFVQRDQDTVVNFFRKKTALALAPGLVMVTIFVACAAFWLVTSWHSAPTMPVPPRAVYEQTLTIAADFDYEPYSFIDDNGEIAGHDVELMYRLAEKLKMNVDIRLLQWSSARAAVVSGKADVLVGLEFNPLGFDEVALSMPIGKDPFVAFGSTPLQGINHLLGARIAVLGGSGSLSAFLRPFRLEKRVTEYATYGEVFDSVANGDNDFAIARYSVGRRAAARFADVNITAAGPVLVDNLMCLGVHKEATALLERVDAAIVELYAEGTLNELRVKWLGSYVDIDTFWDFVSLHSSQLIAIFMASLLLLALYYCYVFRGCFLASEVQLTELARVVAYEQLFIEATKGLYESVLELNITCDRAFSASSREYFEKLGLSVDAPYSEALCVLAEKEIKPDFVQGYLDMFNPKNILELYTQGITNFHYEFQVLVADGTFRWVRATGRIFYWKTDDSIHLITYRQSIDAEKRQELSLLEKAQRDLMTGLYNKEASRGLISDALAVSSPERNTHALLILDIDNFKQVNDTYGHAFGDTVIVQFVTAFQRRFRQTDIMGRIGGDEFVIFLKDIPGVVWLHAEAQILVEVLRQEIPVEGGPCRVSGSIGIALYPDSGTSYEELAKCADAALYKTKRRGKNGYTLDPCVTFGGKEHV